MRPTFAIAPLFIGSLLGCASSSDHAEIRGVGEDFFDAVEARDTELAASIVVLEGVFVSTRRG